MTDNQAGKRAAGYARVSTQGQADRGTSLDTQREKIRAYCTMHDLELVEVIEDGGTSAKNLDRPGMRRLVAMIRRHEVDVVVIAKLDRMTRSVRDLGELVELFQRTGVDFASVADHIDTGTAAGRLVLNVMGSVSQWEREVIGERTAEALAHLRSEGRRISRYAAFGYRQTKDGRWVADDHEQRAIELMVELREAGRSFREIGVELKARGFTNRNGQQLAPKVIRAILRRMGERRSAA